MSQRHIVYVRLDALTPAETNPKLHDLPSIIASLDRYGFTNPILVDERTGRMVAGHGRREACISIKENGEAMPAGISIDEDGEWMVPVLRGWASRNDTEANAYIIADNQLTTAGEWHMQTLAPMLEDLITEDAGLMDSIGFTADDIDDLIRRVDPDTYLDPEGDDTSSSASREASDEDDEAEATQDQNDPDDDRHDDDDDDDDDGEQKHVTCPECGYDRVSIP